MLLLDVVLSRNYFFISWCTLGNKFDNVTSCGSSSSSSTYTPCRESKGNCG